MISSMCSAAGRGIVRAAETVWRGIQFCIRAIRSLSECCNPRTNNRSDSFDLGITPHDVRRDSANGQNTAPEDPALAGVVGNISRSNSLSSSDSFASCDDVSFDYDPELDNGVAGRTSPLNEANEDTARQTTPSPAPSSIPAPVSPASSTGSEGAQGMVKRKKVLKAPSVSPPPPPVGFPKASSTPVPPRAEGAKLVTKKSQAPLPPSSSAPFASAERVSPVGKKRQAPLPPSPSGSPVPSTSSPTLLAPAEDAIPEVKKKQAPLPPSPASSPEPSSSSLVLLAPAEDAKPAVKRRPAPQPPRSVAPYNFPKPSSSGNLSQTQGSSSEEESSDETTQATQDSN